MNNPDAGRNLAAIVACWIDHAKTGDPNAAILVTDLIPILRAALDYDHEGFANHCDLMRLGWQSFGEIEPTLESPTP